MKSPSCFKKYVISDINSEEFYTFVQSIHNSHAQMSLRQIILCILMTTVIAPARGQNAAGSNIVSRTVLSSDTARVLEQRVYDNRCGIK